MLRCALAAHAPCEDLQGSVSARKHQTQHVVTRRLHQIARHAQQDCPDHRPAGAAAGGTAGHPRHRQRGHSCGRSCSWGDCLDFSQAAHNLLASQPCIVVFAGHSLHAFVSCPPSLPQEVGQKGGAVSEGTKKNGATAIEFRQESKEEALDAQANTDAQESLPAAQRSPTMRSQTALGLALLALLLAAPLATHATGSAGAGRKDGATAIEAKKEGKEGAAQENMRVVASTLLGRRDIVGQAQEAN
ncbi:hypothetical protein ABPG75_010008 [Micractinium tetrahymenae]